MFTTVKNFSPPPQGFSFKDALLKKPIPIQSTDRPLEAPVNMPMEGCSNVTIQNKKGSRKVLKNYGAIEGGIFPESFDVVGNSSRELRANNPSLVFS